MGREYDLIQAVKNEDVATVQRLLTKVRTAKNKLLSSTKRINVNYQDSDGFSALHHAALTGSSELLLLLLETQATVDIKDVNGMRPLHYAAWQGQPQPVRLLLHASTSVNAASNDGQIPLHLSAQYGHYEVCEILLQHQSNPCHVSKAKKTPLDLASEFGRVKVVQLLLNSHLCVSLLEGVTKDPTDPNFTTPLHLAAKNGHREVIRLLLQAGIEINQVTKMGTALHQAALCGKTEVVKLLIENGIDVNIRNTYNQTALDIVNQFTTTHVSTDIKQLLREASGILKVRALKDFWNTHDPTALNIRAGDLITVLEQHPDGRWKGHIHDSQKGTDRVGFFPPAIVEVISKRLGSTLSRAASVPHQHLTKISLQLPNQYVTATGVSMSPELIGAGDRQSVGSEGSLGSVHSAGSGQSSEGSGFSSLLLIENAQNLHIRYNDHQNRIPTGTAPAPMEYTAEKDRTVYMQGKDAELIYCWLRNFQLDMYVGNFMSAGYDLLTISRMTPEDLTAIGVTKPGHRKKISTEIGKMNVPDGLPHKMPLDLWDWLAQLGLLEYHKQLTENGYESLTNVTELTWEGLQEIGILRLGHQKKLLLGVKRLLDLEKGYTVGGTLEKGYTVGGTLRSRTPGSLATTSFVEALENEVPTSPKRQTFQNMELSKELQTALTSGGDFLCATGRSYSQESISSRSQGSGHCQESTNSSQPFAFQTTDTTFPERNLPEGIDLFQWPSRVLNGLSVRPEPPIPPPKPSKKKNSLSICRYALSDGEPEEEDKGSLLGTRALSSYVTLTRHPGRSSLTNGQSAEKVQRSQSFAVRARRKGPPPPPPKRLSSMSSVDTSLFNGPSLIKNQEALTEGGPELRTSNTFKSDTFENPGGRRRTVSESAAGTGERLCLSVTDREEEGKKEETVPSQNSSSESIPFAEEGNLTIKQRPKPQGSKAESVITADLFTPVVPLATLKSEASSDTFLESHINTGVLPLSQTATIQPLVEGKPQLFPKPNTDIKVSSFAPITRINMELEFHLTESDTVKRRPKGKDEDAIADKKQASPTSPMQMDTISLNGPHDTVGARIVKFKKGMILDKEDFTERSHFFAPRYCLWSQIGQDLKGMTQIGSQTHIVISEPELVLQKPSWGTSSVVPSTAILWTKDTPSLCKEFSDEPFHIKKNPQLEHFRSVNPRTTEERQELNVETIRSETTTLAKNILDDISTMFDDLAEQLEAMLD